MNPERAARVERVFLEAVEQPAALRGDFIEKACGDDHRLRKHVLELLAHHADDNGLLDSKDAPGRSLLSQLGALALPAEEPTLPADRKIGAYTVLGLLGAGGMGVVYVAQQDRPRRTVALKVLRTGANSGRLLRRFEYEAEVLGRLQHPGIAHVHEAGVYRAGTMVYPFIAMELIRGKPLVAHAEARGLGVRARLELFARVCDAVQHAHQQGVIHRDLKPANILVPDPEPGQTGGDTHPKVLDFGVARAMDRTGDDTTAHTGVGQIIGTLPYMSPEQIAGDSDRVDTRSDVYSLGVVLYELLSGRLPYDVRSRTLPDAARVIRDEPPTRLSTISRVFRGDIDTIVSTALAKEKARRYQSAADLAADVRRYLGGEALAARGDSAMYLLRKQLRRYRGAVAAALVGLAGLVGFAVYATIQAQHQARLAASEHKAGIEANQAKEEALLQANRADAAARDLAAQLRTSNIERGRALAISGSLRAAEELIWPEHLKDPADPYARWALWDVYSRQPCVATIMGGQSPAIAAAFSPDGARFAAGTRDGTIRICLTNTGTVERALSAGFPGKGVLFCVDWSPDGAWLACGDAEGHVRVINARTGLPLHELTCGTKPVRQVRFSRDGAMLAAGGESGIVQVWTGWQNASPARRTLAPSRPSPIFGIAISPDCTRLGAIFLSGALVVWRLDAAEPPLTITANPPGGRSLAFLPDGKHIMTGGADRAAHLWDLADGTLMQTFRVGKWPVSDLAVTPDGATLITVGWLSAELWDIATGKRTLELSGHTDNTSSLAVSPDGRHVVTASMDNTLRLWELEPGTHARTLGRHGGSVNDVSFSGDGSLVATACRDGQVRVFDGYTGAQVTRIDAHKDGASVVAFDPAGTLLISGGVDGPVRVWEPRSGQLLREFTGHAGEVLVARFIPGTHTLITGGRDHTIRQWNPADGTSGPWGEPSRDPIGYLDCDGVEGQIAFSPSRGVGLWTPAQPGPATALGAGGRAWCLAYLPDRRTLALGTWDGTVELWDVPDKRLVNTFAVHDQLVANLAPSPDGTMLAVTCVSGAIRLLDPKSGRVLLSLDQHRGNAFSAAFSPDGTRLATASEEGRAILWDLRRYDGHIEGNREYWKSRMSEKQAGPPAPP